MFIQFTRFLQTWSDGAIHISKDNSRLRFPPQLDMASYLSVNFDDILIDKLSQTNIVSVK